MKHKPTLVYSTWKSSKFNLRKTAALLKMTKKEVRGILQDYLNCRMKSKMKYKSSEENANRLLEAVREDVEDVEEKLDFNPEKEIAWFDSEKWLKGLRENDFKY